MWPFEGKSLERQRINAHSPSRQVHQKSGATEWPVAGPGAAKNEFVSYIEKHAPRLKSQLIGVEPMGHPTDGQLLGHARRFFKAADKILPREA